MDQEFFIAHALQEWCTGSGTGVALYPTRINPGVIHSLNPSMAGFRDES